MKNLHGHTLFKQFEIVTYARLLQVTTNDIFSTLKSLERHDVIIENSSFQTMIYSPNMDIPTHQQFETMIYSPNMDIPTHQQFEAMLKWEV